MQKCDAVQSCSERQMEVDLSYMELDVLPQHYVTETSEYSPASVRSVILRHNRLTSLSDDISRFQNVVALDLSGNLIADLPEAILQLTQLRILIAKNNQLNCTSLPKSLAPLSQLEVVNFSGNQFDEFPPQIFDIPMLKTLYLGSNGLKNLPCRIGDMTTLEVLYLGGNQLKDIPATIGKLKSLSSLVLCDNILETIPSTVANLQRLQSLSLHNNRLTTLPTEIATLQQLQELSIRSNPLVARFVRDMTFDPPSLKELASRVVKIKSLSYTVSDLPATLISYLASAHQCVNPKCKGVYFEARVEHVKFVDFCGKYRVPLMQYLCSPRCSDTPAYHLTTSDSDTDTEDDLPVGKMKKVLLG